MVMTGSRLDSSGIYRLHGRGVFDFAGNPLDSAHSTAVFAGSNLPDTVRPRFAVVALRDSARGYPPDQPIEVDFSKPVLQEPIHAAVSLADSARHPVEFSIRWLGPTDLLLSPQHELWGRAWYRLQMTLDSVIDMHGARYRDSTFSLRFQTMDFRNTGVINGVVVMDSAGGARGPVYVTAAGVDQTSPPKKSVKLASPGKFSLDRLPEGKYTIGAFIDADSSGSYTYGSPFPFVPSERFTVFADTVKVRARWSVEGVNLRFR
jgi:hypothetical protein